MMHVKMFLPPVLSWLIIDDFILHHNLHVTGIAALMYVNLLKFFHVSLVSLNSIFHSQLVFIIYTWWRKEISQWKKTKKIQLLFFSSSRCACRGPASFMCFFSCPLWPPALSLLQGIERLKGETGKWDKVPCWEAMQAACGGPFSLSWCSPFSGLRCEKRPLEALEQVPQGEIIEEDIIEIPLY